MKDGMRDTILDAADRLLVRYGYRKMTVDDLAAEAGIGKGTVYLYFPSKQEVVLCWIDRRIGRLVEHLREIAATDAAPAERIREMLVTRVLFLQDAARDHQHVLDEIFQVLRTAYMPRRETYFAWEGEVFEAVLREGQASGDFRPGDPEQIARALVLATNAQMPFSQTANFALERERAHRNVQTIADLLLRGLCTGPGLRLP